VSSFGWVVSTPRSRRDGTSFRRSGMGGERISCPDCGCDEGDLHDLLCEFEECPFCGGQLISCDCHLKHFFPNLESYKGKYLSAEQAVKWTDHLIKTGRVPRISYPVRCRKCGIASPKLFMVPNAEWKRYVSRKHRKIVLCRACYDRIKLSIDAHAGNAESTTARSRTV